MNNDFDPDMGGNSDPAMIGDSDCDMNKNLEPNLVLVRVPHNQEHRPLLRKAILKKCEGERKIDILIQKIEIALNGVVDYTRIKPPLREQILTYLDLHTCRRKRSSAWLMAKVVISFADQPLTAYGQLIVTYTTHCPLTTFHKST